MTENERPRLIVVAGPNGAGKTSITEQLLMHEWMAGCVYVNPDLIARDEFGDWNAEGPVLAAARRAQEIREQCLREGRSLAFETVLSAPDKLDFLRRSREAGFFVRLFFIATEDPSINAKRVALRVMEGGHDVPISKIISRHTRSLASGAVAVRLVQRAYVYDNSVDGAPPRLLLRMSEGQVVKWYGHVSAWARGILEEPEREPETTRS